MSAAEDSGDPAVPVAVERSDGRTNAVVSVFASLPVAVNQFSVLSPSSTSVSECCSGCSRKKSNAPDCASVITTLKTWLAGSSGLVPSM